MDFNGWDAQSYFDDVIRSLAVGVVVLNDRGKITTSNRRAAEIRDLSFDDVSMKHFDDVFGPNFLGNSPLSFCVLEDTPHNKEIEAEICPKGNGTVCILAIPLQKNWMGSN